MNLVSFGDWAEGKIVTVALPKTAEMDQEILPDIVEVLGKASYVDDIIESFDCIERAENLKMNIEKIIKPKRFKIKKWLTFWKDR